VDPNSWKNGTPLVSIVLPAIMQSYLKEEWIKVGILNNVVYTYITRQNAIHGDRPPIHLTVQYEVQVISMRLTMMQFFSIPYWFVPLKPRLAAFNFQASAIYIGHVLG
jgi:hypothetical protein